MDDRTYADASTANGTAALDPMTAQHDDPAAVAGGGGGGAASLRPMFLSELAGAMHAAAARERERIASVMSDDAAAHVEKTRARAEIETAELRRLADDDVTRIEEWSTSETKRIRAEANQRISERRANLDDYLRQHDAIIAAEVGAVEAAVADYEATLDAFFAELGDSNDPSEIVRRAEQLPALPDLDAIRAKARGEAVGRYAAPADEAAPADAGTDAAAGVATGDVVAEAVADEPPAGEVAVAEASDTATAEPDTAAEHVVAADAPEDPLIGSTDQAAVVESTAPTVAVDASPSDGGWGSTVEPVQSTVDTPVEASADPGGGWGDSGDDAVRAVEQQPAVGVMDPAASAAANGWATEEPVTVGAPADHTSAAVRLLRSVAPWTAPNHNGDHQRPTDQG